ncbi:MAG: diguanylate cyclase [Myxococcota bacterium]
MALGLDSVGRKLLWGIALPAVLVAVGGVVFFWRQAERAVSEATRDEAVALAELLSTTFTLTDRKSAEDAPASVHRSVTEAMRSDWKMFRYVSGLRIVDRRGVVRWSRRVEEEGKPHPESTRLLAVGPQTVQVDTSPALPVLGGKSRIELVRPLGGMACAGCHTGQTTMKVGVLQLTIDEPKLHQQVQSVFRGALYSVLLFAAVLAAATAIGLRVFVTHPLRRLTAAMRRAEDGDFLVRADERRNDELGALSFAFNRMLARITSMKAEEIDKNRDLQAAQEQLLLKRTLEETNAKLENRLTELSTLNDVARLLSSTLEPGEVFSRITSLVPDRLRIPKFSIMLLNAEGKLEVKSAVPAGLGTEGMTFDVGEGACGKAAQTKKSLYIPDLGADSSIFRVRGGSAHGRGSLLCLPMLHGGVLLGVINFERPEAAGFSAEEIDFLTTVADQVAMAVKNAQLHEQTVELSITDPLTGVPNRRHLFSRLELEINRANRFGTQVSLLMVDIDHFKHLNDAAGHRAGDDVLRKVCEQMKTMTRKVDVLGRYGGEEFLLILPQVSKAEAIEVAEKLRRSVEEAPLPHAQVQPGGRVTISVGVSNLPADASEQERLVDCADSALYASKRAGRNKVTGYASGMELHPGRERGPFAAKRTKSGETKIPSLPGRGLG